MDIVKDRAFEFVDCHRTEMLSLWEELVTIESGSQNKENVDLIVSRLQQFIADDAAKTRIAEFEKAGNMVIATYGTQREKSPVAFLGHMDTVFSKGTIDQRPFRIKDGKAYGPGVLDMKGGIVVLLYAIKALEAAGYDSRPLKIILAGDEETAHAHSNAAEVIMQEVMGCVAAFNCESGSVDDHLVIGRKGGATFTMETHGIAAHTGNNPKAGRSAILELAHKIMDIHNLTDWEEGTLFNVGTIQGGTGCNVTPDYAKIEIGVRCTSETAVNEFTSQLKNIAAKTYVEGTQTTLSGGIGFMPMVTTPAVIKLFELVAKTSLENGFGKPISIQSGGASDSAYSVIAGIPTVCAMGVKGEKNHSPEEYALVESLFERTKLLIASVLNLDTLQFN
jgi:glutamate carboxypeptidase